MSDFVVGGAAVEIRPVFISGFRQMIQKEFNNVLSSEATKAGRDAGENMADEIGKQGKEAGEKFTDEVAKGTKAQGRKTTKAAEDVAKGMDKPFEKAGKESGNKFADGLKKAMGPIAGILAGVSLVDQVGDTISKSSNAEQSLGATEALYKDHSGKVIKMSEEAAEKYGLSANTYRESSNLMAALFKNQGVELDQLAGKTDAMVGVGADLAAQFGGTTAESVEALSAAFKGEYDMLDRYGISMNESMVTDELKARGQDKLTGQALALAKQTVKTDIITKQSADSMGAAAREADTFAGSQARLTAKVDNLKASVGKPLTDALASSFGFIAETVLPALVTFGGWLNDNKVSLGIFAGSLAVIAVGANASAIGMGIAAGATSVWAGAMRVFNAVMNMNPIMKIVGLIGLLIAGVIYAYKNFEGFRTIVDGAWTGIKNAAAFAWAGMKVVFEAIVGFIRTKLVPVVVWLYENIIKPYFNLIKTIIAVAITAVVLIIKGLIYVWEKVLAPAIKSVWENVLKPVFNALGTFFKWVWDTILKPAFNNFVNGFKALGTAIKWSWDNVLKPVFRALGDFFKWVWDTLLKPAFRNIKDGFGTLVSGIKAFWNDKLKPIFSALGNFIRDKVAPVFQKGVDKIKGIWESIRNIAKAPIKFVVETVINEGLIGAFNGVAKFLKMDGIAPIKLPDGFATGGWTGPGGKYKPAGVVHADEFVIKKESTNKLRKKYGLKGLNFMNRTGELPDGYSGGGMVRPANGPYTSQFGASRGAYPHQGTDIATSAEIFAALAGTVKRTGFSNVLPGRTGNGILVDHGGGFETYYGHLRNGGTMVQPGDQVNKGQQIGWAGSTGNSTGNHLHFETHVGGKAVNPMQFLNGAAIPQGGGGFDPLAVFSGLADKLGGMFTDRFPAGGQMVEMAKGMGGRLIGDVKEWATSKLAAIGDFVGDIGRNITGNSPKQQVRGVAEHYGWNKGNQWASLNELIRRESGWDPNAANPNSTARGLFQKMTSDHGPIEATADGQAKWGLDYIKKRYGDPQGAINHHDRKGWYANGGLVNAGLYDDGGWLQPGLTAALNKSGKPEAILTANEWQSVHSLIKQNEGRGGDTYTISVPKPQASAIEIVNEIKYQNKVLNRGGRR